MKTLKPTRFGVFRAAAVVAAVVLACSAAFAQKAPSPGTHITVSKTTRPTDANPDVGMFSSIQEAVNAATNGQVIEILDTEVYEEQVTIDGRDVSPWDGNNGGPVKKVVGKKNGITIRYVPSASEKAGGNYKRPTIKWKDTQNQSPKTVAESKTEGELPGSSGNFETCGALRIIRAQGVTIDGIAVDGGGQAMFAWGAIWNSKDALVHGNAAVTLVVAGGAVIRNCDLRNAYIGLNVKDRNTGGVFGMRNPADPDDPVPLSGFGKVGYHLIEYNRIHESALGIFFESAWDLGSTVRYNLIYNNVNDATTKALINGSGFPGDAKNNMASGAIMFKDMVYSPVAIYNNTFYRNEMNFIGHWKVGAPHLMFNNIFGKSTVQVTTNGGNAPQFGYDFMAMDGAFQYRMHNSTFSAYLKLDAQGQDVYVDYTCTPQNYDTLWIRDVTIWNSFATAAKSKLRIDYTYCGKSKEEDAVVPGALLTGGARGFPNDANVRWLEMSKQTVTTNQSKKSLVFPDLFQSVNEADPKFLWPDWEHQHVKDYIQNKGWTTVGIRNADNNIADLGAISSNNDVHQPTLVRIKPTNVVLLNNTTARASFFLTLESGTMTSPKIKFLRWVAPIPNNYSNFGGSDAPIIPQASIRNITPPTTTLNFGSNNFDFTVPQMTMRDTLFGFFEVVVEGTGANGQVVSDVGFLPYRNLDYKLDIRVFAGNATSTTGAGLDTVRAGEPYKVVVTPQRSNGGTVTYTLNEVTYDLLSDPTAFMYQTPGDKPLVDDKGVGPGAKTYTVYFTHAGAETIMGAGVYDQGSNHLVFLGTKDLVVKPGAPDQIVFLNPIPKSQLGTASAPVINRGAPYEVQVEVRDKWNNAVDVAVQVTLKSESPAIGNVGAAGVTSGITPASPAVTAPTDTKTGIATFSAHVTNGNPRDEFDMTASFSTGGASGSDIGRLRVGRSVDRLEVFYSDTGSSKNYQTYFDPDVGIDGRAGTNGDWFKVTVKVVGPDTVITSRTGQFVFVDDGGTGLILSATEKGAPATTFALTNGVATFWISANTEISEACLNVSALRSNDPTDVDGSVSSGNRCNIKFTMPRGSILRATVFGDGHGRPDSLLIYYGGDAEVSENLPDKVTLEWPVLESAGGVLFTAPKANISLWGGGDRVVHVNLATATLPAGIAARPTGYTSFANEGRGLVKVYGGVGGEDGNAQEFFDVLDAVGPVLANNVDAGKNPRIIENLNPGVAADTLIIKLSEQPKKVSGEDLIGANTLLYYNGEGDPVNEPGATGGDPLNVLDAVLDDPSVYAYKVTVAPITGGLQNGNWIRLNPAGPLVDRAGRTGTEPAYTHPDNKAHANNRWVKLDVIQVAPTIFSAHYTSNPVTGKVDFAYVKFDKEVDINGWFAGPGGYVKIGTNKSDSTGVTLANAGALFSVDPTDKTVLVVDLTEAYKSSQSAIRTSGDMPVAFGFVSSWDGWADVKSTARDRAAPVLADTVYLKLGSLLDPLTNEKTPDTLIVVYSERPDAESIALPNPVTILTGSGCVPTLGDPKPSDASGGFYRVTYLVENMNCNTPKTGDYARINSGATAEGGVGDNIIPSNRQTAADNMKWPIKVIPGKVNWKIVVKSNPFRSDPSGTRGVTVSLRPGVSDEASDVEADAKVLVFDNLGNVVVDTLVGTVMKDELGTGEYKVIEWRWNGYNKKGRLVGTGTYLFKALCEVRTKTGGGSDATVDRQRYSVTKSLGVVRQ